MAGSGPRTSHQVFRRCRPYWSADAAPYWSADAASSHDAADAATGDTEELVAGLCGNRRQRPRMHRRRWHPGSRRCGSEGVVMSKEALPISDEYMVRRDIEARFGGHEEFNDNGEYSKGELEGMGSLELLDGYAD